MVERNLCFSKKLEANHGLPCQSPRFCWPIHTDFPVNSYLWRKNVIPGENLFKIQVETSISQWHGPEMYPSVPPRLRDVLRRDRKIPIMIPSMYQESFHCPHGFVLQSTSDDKINQVTIIGNLQLLVPLQLPPSDSTTTTLSNDILRSFPYGAWEVKNKRGASPW